MATLASQGFTTALTGTASTALPGLGGFRAMTFVAAFTYVASSATSADAYVQTSLDGGVTWLDVVNFHFTTASLTKSANVDGGAQIAPVTTTTGTLASNTANQGLLGDQWRVLFVTVGTYGSGSAINVYYQTRN